MNLDVVFFFCQAAAGWYSVFRRPSTWLEARDFCQEMGGELAEPDSNVDKILAEFLVELFDQINPGM